MSLPNVHRVTRGGRLYRYHRVTRAALPANLPEDHPDFIAAWLAEERKGAPKAEAPAMAPGTIGRTVDDYLDSRDLSDVSASYRGIIRRHLLAVAGGKLGRALMRDLGARHIRLDIEALAPAVAQARLKAWRRLLDWCQRRGILDADPSAGIAKPRLSGDGHSPWTPDEVAAFRARWPIGTAPRAAMELLHWTGARVSDASGLTRGMIRGGILSYRQSKTGGEAHVPWDGPLPAFARGMAADRAMMHEALAALGGDGLLILPTQDGKRRSPKGLSNTVNDAAREADLVERTAHGLRKTRLTALADARATTHQIAAWGGHLSLTEVEHYTKAADRRRAVSGVNRPVKRKKEA